MLTSKQLDVLIERASPFTEAEEAAFAAIVLPTAEQVAADPGADAAALAPWLASIGISGPPPRVAMTATKLATAARRVAAWG